MTKTLALFFTFLLTTGMSQDVFAREIIGNITKIHYNGKIYTGALVASEIVESEFDSKTYYTLLKPRVVVYNANFGFNKVFEIDSKSNNIICLNMGLKYTSMNDAQTIYGPVAHFIKKDEVVIDRSTNGDSTRRSIDCSDFLLPSI